MVLVVDRVTCRVTEDTRHTISTDSIDQTIRGRTCALFNTETVVINLLHINSSWHCQFRNSRLISVVTRIVTSSLGHRNLIISLGTVVFHIEGVVITRTILNQHQECVTIIVFVITPDPGSETHIPVPPGPGICKVETCIVTHRVVVTISVRTIMTSVIQRVILTVSQFRDCFRQSIVISPAVSPTPNGVTTVIPVVVETTIVTTALRVSILKVTRTAIVVAIVG